MALSFDDLLGQLIPLFEQKVAWSMKMGERELSLKEKAEQNKTDLEYKRLEDVVAEKGLDRAWEKEKLLTTIRSNYDLKSLEEKGLVNRLALQLASQKELQDAKIVADKEARGDEIKQKNLQSNLTYAAAELEAAKTKKESKDSLGNVTSSTQFDEDAYKQVRRFRPEGLSLGTADGTPGPTNAPPDPVAAQRAKAVEGARRLYNTPQFAGYMDGLQAINGDLAKNVAGQLAQERNVDVNATAVKSPSISTPTTAATTPTAQPQAVLDARQKVVDTYITPPIDNAPQFTSQPGAGVPEDPTLARNLAAYQAEKSNPKLNPQAEAAAKTLGEVGKKFTLPPPGPLYIPITNRRYPNY